jgi:hypothetical protein
MTGSTEKAVEGLNNLSYVKGEILDQSNPITWITVSLTVLRCLGHCITRLERYLRFLVTGCHLSLLAWLFNGGRLEIWKTCHKNIQKFGVYYKVFQWNIVTFGRFIEANKNVLLYRLMTDGVTGCLDEMFCNCANGHMDKEILTLVK